MNKPTFDPSRHQMIATKGSEVLFTDRLCKCGATGLHWASMKISPGSIEASAPRCSVCGAERVVHSSTVST